MIDMRCLVQNVFKVTVQFPSFNLSTILSLTVVFFTVKTRCAVDINCAYSIIILRSDCHCASASQTGLGHYLNRKYSFLYLPTIKDMVFNLYRFSFCLCPCWFYIVSMVMCCTFCNICNCKATIYNTRSQGQNLIKCFKS